MARNYLVQRYKKVMTDGYKQLKKIQNNKIYLTLCHIQIAYIALYESNIHGYQQSILHNEKLYLTD